MKKLIISLAVISAVATPFIYGECVKEDVLSIASDTLADPESARFRNVRISSNWTVAGSVACGEVNARNRAGGYVGYQRFVVLGSGFSLIGDDALVQKTCKLLDDPSPWWYFRR